MPLIDICSKCETKLAVIGTHCQFCYEEIANILFEAWAYCDWKDKSTEFMLEYMQDKADVGLDYVIDFIQRESKNRKAWYDKHPNWTEKYT